ncbi:MAG: hypothetical protein WAQ98_13215 [Blastocatellia bacterium]
MARNRTRTKNNTIKIVSETPAKRCEICHKSDEYDSELNTCNRCEGVTEFSLIDHDWTGSNANNEANHLNNPNPNPNRINISRNNNTLLADRPNPSNPFDQLNQIYSSNYFDNFNQSSFSQPNEVNQVEEVNEVIQIIEEIEEVEEVNATDGTSTLNQANIDDDRDELEEMDKSYPLYESTKVNEANEVNQVDKLSDSTTYKPFNAFPYQPRYGSLNYRPIIVGLMVMGFIICIFFLSSSHNSKSLSLYDLTVKNGKIIKDEILTVNTEVDKTNSVESENTSDTNSTEVEEIPYQLDLSLANPQDNSYVTLAVDGVTVIESDEPILKVINGSESLAIEQSSFPTKKLYLIGKDTLDSGNLILITKTSVFSLYYEIRTDAIPGNFNILVKSKNKLIPINKSISYYLYNLLLFERLCYETNNNH